MIPESRKPSSRMTDANPQEPRDGSVWSGQHLARQHPLEPRRRLWSNERSPASPSRPLLKDPNPSQGHKKKWLLPLITTYSQWRWEHTIHSQSFQKQKTETKREANHHSEVPSRDSHGGDVETSPWAACGVGTNVRNKWQNGGKWNGAQSPWLVRAVWTPREHSLNCGASLSFRSPVWHMGQGTLT